MKFAFALTLLAAGGCFTQLSGQTILKEGDSPESAPSQASQTYGKVDGDTYISPTGLFSIKIPVLPELGGTISDTPNVVTFDDDYSVHLSVGAFPLSPELKSEYETRGAKDFLINFFTGIVMPDFVANFPGSKLEKTAAFLPQFQGGAVLLYSLHPGGSNFERRTRFSIAIPPVVAKRGNICFVRSGYVFVISTELAERAIERSTYKQTPEEENAILRKRLLDIVAKMQFTPPVPGMKN